MISYCIFFGDRTLFTCSSSVVSYIVCLFFNVQNFLQFNPDKTQCIKSPQCINISCMFNMLNAIYRIAGIRNFRGVLIFVIFVTSPGITKFCTHEVFPYLWFSTCAINC